MDGTGNSETLKVRSDVTRPKVESYADKNTSIFKELYSECFSIFGQILNQNRSDSVGKLDFCSNNIVSFIGPRGSGKTSCMTSVAKMLEEACEGVTRDREHLAFCENRKFHFLKMMDPAIFSKQVINILRELYNDESVAKLRSQFVVLNADTMKEYGDNYDNELKDIVDENNQAYNISIGDVFYLLTHLILLETSENMRKFIFYIKTLYTIKLTEYAEDEDLQAYRELIGGAFICLTGTTLIGKKIATNVKREIQLMDGDKLNTCVEKVVEGYEKKHGNIEDLQVVEFFMLAISRYVSDSRGESAISTKNYRLSRDIYYDCDLSEVKNIKFDVLSPIFNCIDKEKAYARFSEEIYEIAKKEPESLVNKLSFVCLTNYEDIEQLFKYLSKTRISGSDTCEVMSKFYGRVKLAGDRVPEVYRQCYEAAAIRVRLFEIIQEIGETDYDMPDFDAGFESATRKLQYRINSYREHYGRKINGKRYDYAITSSKAEELTAMNVFDGEKNILYSAMVRIFQNPGDKLLTGMLHRYVLAKSKFRQFIEQPNGKKGFANFSIYERHKDMMLDAYPAYKRIALTLAAEESLRLHNVTSLETRIAPKNDLRKMLADFLMTEKYCRAGLDAGKQDVRFVYHFIKRYEDDTREGFVRQHRLRHDIRRQTLNMVVMHRYKRKVFEKLVGVDAANTELGCSPEVFAQSFRYLRKRCEGRLHFTYHAGEDFYDIADGLRAIDEAIHLLHLGNGERIGHGLALGTIAHYYYHRQECTIAISKQCLLDNCAWLLVRSQELGISMAPKVRHMLESWFNRLLCEIKLRGQTALFAQNGHVVVGTDT